MSTLGKRFAALPADRPPAEAEGAVAAFWREARIFEKSLERTRGGPPHVFYEGPPTANGMPHHGHVLTRAIKDLFPRYKTMCGFHVDRKAGWDTHGLPVELEVEKALGLEGKQDIERFGVAPFIDRCKESVWKYKGEWERLTERIGFWIDLSAPYITYAPEYVQSVWWALERLHAQGLLYRGHKILNWCPRDMTGLSAAEVGQAQLEVTDPAATVAFALEPAAADPDGAGGGDAGGEPEHALAWTTTPWTLVSNVALAVHPDLEYAWVRHEGKTYVLAAARVAAVLGKKAEVVRTAPGRTLLGRRYRPLYEHHGALDASAHVVVAGDFVTTGDGTGIVHCAPAFGEDDQRVCRDAGLAFVCLVGPDGRFVPGAGPFAGMWFKDADKEVRRDLRQRGLLVRDEQYVHNYPHCWRCGTPLLYYAREAWFIRTTAVKDRLVALNQGIAWAPEHIRDGRFGDFLANNKDWALSRERYWGTPLPIWECAAQACDGRVVVGSLAALRRLNPAVPEDLDPHRPGIDAVTVPCPKCGGEARRVPDVIDCWFDSGAMPFAQWGYPHQPGSEALFERNAQADFISEAIDQTRGWFYTLHAISTLLFDRPAFQRCLVLGHVLDAQGKKLSKKDKNYTPPAALIEQHGADAVRWFFYANMTPGQGVRFVDDAVRDARRTFLLKVLNVYKFFEEYASSDGFDPRPGGTPRAAVADREPLDRWIVSELHRATEDVRRALDGYDFHAAATTLEAFVDALSNWYVRRSRERGWRPPAPEDASKWAFWWTTWEVLGALARLLAPFTPFLADDLHRVLEREPLGVGAPGGPQESVHLEAYPAPDPALRDPALEARMRLARRVVNLGLQVRTQARLNVRQPLRQAVVLLSSPTEEEDVQALRAVIEDELNVKALVVSREHDRYVTFDVRVQFPRLGPRFGKRLGAVRKALGGVDPGALAAAARAGRPVELALEDGTAAALEPDDLDVRLAARDGFAAAQEGGAVVVLDTTLDDGLLREGLARELQARIQGLRKELALPFDARVEAWVWAGEGAAPAAADGDLEAVVAAHGEALRRETLSDALRVAPPPGDARRTEASLGGRDVVVAVRVVG